MSTHEALEVRVQHLDVDPQDHPEFRAPELELPDDEQLVREYLEDETAQQAVGAEHEEPQIVEPADFPASVVRRERRQDSVQTRKKHLRLRKFGIKAVAVASAAGLAVGAGVAGINYLEDTLIPKAPVPKSERKLEVGVGAPETITVRDVTLNFMDSTSRFDYDYHSSLNRPWNPSNCDMDADQKVRTTAATSIFIEQATIVKTGDKATITVDGDVSAQTNISFDEDALDIDMATGGVDACSINNDVGIADTDRTDEWDELDWAKAISYSTIADAGVVAESCAREEVGESAFEEAIIYNARLFSEKLQSVDPSQIKVILSKHFGEQAKDDYNKAVTDFYANFNRIATEYYSFNDDRKPKDGKGGIVLNATHLIKCDDHDIKVKPNANVPSDARSR